MEALICPECGGKVAQPETGSEYAKCAYCSTNFRIGEHRPVFSDASVSATTGESPNPAGSTPFVVIAMIIVTVVGIVAFEMFTVRNSTSQTVNSAQTAANDAHTAANKMREAAEAMANAAQQQAVNAVKQAQNPTPRNK
jgi:hypothetical protein